MDRLIDYIRKIANTLRAFVEFRRKHARKQYKKNKMDEPFHSDLINNLMDEVILKVSYHREKNGRPPASA